METRRAVLALLHGASVILAGRRKMKINGSNVMMGSRFPRRVCVTEKRYVAAVPVGSKVGDILVAVLGVSVPFVLRVSSAGGGGSAGPLRGRLVGECYCHGMMDREALNLGRGAEDLTLVK
jgi:hypothetical protein